jgi:beta-glucanase (GH16 family)
MPMQRALPPAAPNISYSTCVVALFAVIGLLIGLGAQLVTSAGGADGAVIRQVADSSDAGAVDLNRDGAADLARYGAHRRELSVGEDLSDGTDLRLFLPFTVSTAMLNAAHRGGSANVAMQVRRVANLRPRRLVVDAYVNGTAATKPDYRRPASRLAVVVPAGGRTAVDVSRVLRSMTRPGSLTLRLRLDVPSGRDRSRVLVDVATSEARIAAHRPTLSVSALGHASTTTPTASRPPAPTQPPTTASTAPPTPPPTVAPTPPSTTAPNPPSPPAENEIFRDDFNGSSLDLAKWRPNWLAGDDVAVTKPVNSAEQSCYDPAQVSVGGGSLHLRAVNRACRANNGVTYPYASGLIESAHDFTFTYGRIEARVFVPPGAGAASNWPAFWANGTGTWPVTGELDVFEGLEGRACWHFHSTAGGPGGCAPWSSPGGWHTFGADWRPGSVSYFYDGVQVGQIASGITAAPMYLIFNLGLSPTIAPPVTLPSEMLVDWVRVTR